ncbi:hypothetical protein ACUH7Y_10035 [Clostridium beijerinckii]|uniref:Uncharacterized protein n=2 Tax=Clostridium TaxID=1485 RepID=A0A1W7LU22_CLOBE|nr:MULTISPECIES: hypothetical protein [Clostridium]MBA8935449.1 hypothetical protein [Clostridium beijerinckii]MBN7576546.1 hypothetical protein [Clostridium beijerinckii]MBN7581563.1 hypothetical protein [Clostridium beijerinckii]MBN7586303.1 hypothetical protein [Clostridium beijerinckii]MBO0522320.1 hypothetical protein [Clostridium beijerinckii]
MERYENKCKCTKHDCELCSTIKSKPVNLEKHGAKLVTVKIKVNNVCLGKKVAIAAILYDDCDRILAFKGFVTMAHEDPCDRDACGTIERKIVFVIPEHEECDPERLRVRTIGNYIYPCEPNK